MKATEARFVEFLEKSPQFVIPIYQRTYSWTERECRQLWNDILRTGSNDAIAAHFAFLRAIINAASWVLSSSASAKKSIR